MTTDAGTPKTEPTPLRKAMERAFHLGQTYWQQADSEYTSHHRKADVTRQKFDELCAKYSTAMRAER